MPHAAFFLIEKPKGRNKENISMNSVEKNQPGDIFLIGPSSPFRGGIAHYNSLLYNEMLARNLNVTFYTFKKQYFRFLYPGKDDRDYSIDKIGLNKVENGNGKNSHVKQELHPLNIMSWVRAGKIAKNYPVIILPWWVSFWGPYYSVFLKYAGNRKARKAKVIFLCHNIKEHENGMWQWLKGYITRHILKLGNGYILHSEGEKLQLENVLKGIEYRALVSPHPTYDIFNKNRFDKVTARGTLGISTERKVLLFFGFIRPYKGLEFLLKGLKLIKTQIPDILLFIVGEVWGKESLYDYYIGLIEKLGLKDNIRFINRYVPNEDVELYFKACDFVVLPYLSGSGSGILQVAYGMDRPVVATRINAFSEVVQEGKTGLLAPPGDETKLAEVIQSMYNGVNLAKMEKEVSQYKKQFGWSYMVDRILELYKQL